jgi:hypothetical protein
MVQTIIHHPPTVINGYLADKLNTLFVSNYIQGGVPSAGNMSVPFFPSMPTDIDALTETFPVSDSRFAVYDRMFKLRRSAFPHIKTEQLLYYFYKFGDSAVKDVIEISEMVFNLLDNGDETAEDINRWVTSNLDVDGYITISNTKTKPVYFHNFKVFQLEETRDLIDFGTARTYAGNKLIIDYSYHRNYPGQASDPISR